MPHRYTRLSHLAPVALALVLASLLLAACGGSSSSSTTSSSAKASTAAGAPTQPSQRFIAFSECLQKNGVVLPKTAAGTPRLGGLIGPSGELRLPAGASRTRFEAAVKKCGGRPGGLHTGTLASPRFVQALGNFAACLRQNGVNVPPPNTSGNGPVFNTNGLNTASATFQAARAKCAPLLAPGFRRQPGAPGTPAAPPAG